MESHVIYRKPVTAAPGMASQELESPQPPDEAFLEATDVVTNGLLDAGVPPEATSALRLVLQLVSRQVDELDGRAHSDAVEAVQCLHGWLDGVAATATRGLHRAMTEQFRPATPEEELTTSELRRWHRDVRKATQTELQTTTGRGARATGQLIDLATAPPQLREAIDEALADGGADSYRAWRVLDATDLLPDLDRATIARAVLPRRPDGTRRSLQSFTKALQRAVQKQVSAVPHLARKRDQQALDRRDSVSRLQDDGTGQVRTTGGVERVVAAHARIDGIARAAKRCGGEPRTLAQLRSDVALDLLQFGIVPAFDDAAEEADEGAAENESSTTDESSTTHESGTTHESDTRRMAEGGLGVGKGAESDTGRGPTLRYRELGQLPPAHVDIVVSLETLLGLSHGIGDLPGLSSISAERARRAAVTAGSVWRRLVIDPLDGHLIEKSSHSYRPSNVVNEQIAARDGICRFPGCQRPAVRAQSDHAIAWTPDSDVPLTGRWNLEKLCEFHHDAKTRALWVAIMSADGEVRWTSPTGRQYTTKPQNWAAATAGTTGAADGTYRWFRDQLDRLIRGEDNALEREDLITAIDAVGKWERQEAGRSVVEQQLTAVLGDWWTNSRAALETVEIWHRTEGGAHRRGLAPGEPVPALSIVPVRQSIEVALDRRHRTPGQDDREPGDPRPDR